jgi:pimeloyl-ACP methyl ester carboxylesterase
MGGYVAFAFWRMHPEMVRALVLADTRAAPDTAEGRENRFKIIEIAQTEGPAAIFEDMLPKVLSPYTLENRPQIVEQTKRMMHGTPVSGVVGALQGMAQRPDSTPTLPTIDVPTLILVGEDDVITPPSEAEAMQQEILSASGAHGRQHKLVTVPQAGHLAPLENPRIVNQALESLLSVLSG